MITQGRKPLEVWGGVECTVNRVGDTYFDQMKSNGHDQRITDLDLFAEIGLKTLRYPFIWERTAPDGIASADWKWADQRLARFQELKMRPIAGFVHHGSGPRYTSLLDPEFGEKLAEYADAFAQRYPWVEDYTPINEAFTTARFSGLYGVWYPHGRTYHQCFKALMNECRGTVLSMKAIRTVNPAARLIQTDDLGRATSTALLGYQADFENERRWIGWDLLCGNVVPGHPLWDFILQQGITPAELLWFAENPCPPNILGVNHYLLSNRYFDEKTNLYPDWAWANNGTHRYVDIESVRVSDAEFVTPKSVLQEAWERYSIPIAVTEVHVDATREEQLRWFVEIWNAVEELRGQGAKIEAITAWGLLGHYDWHCLVTRCEGYYESGVFDLRSPAPRPTAIAKMIHQLNTSGTYSYPTVEMPGWWRRPMRSFYPVKVNPPVPGSAESLDQVKVYKGKSVQPVVITGARGTLGQAFAKVCEVRGVPYRLLSRAQMDIADLQSVQTVLNDLQPWAVINAAGYVRVDQAEVDQERCFRENLTGPVNLAKVCSDLEIPFLSFSSDLVFDGQASQPYVETSQVLPLNIYGQSKAAAEKKLLDIYPQTLVIRTSAFFGPWDNFNFITASLRAIQQGELFSAASDLKVSPTYVPDLVNTALNLIVDGEKGIWHLANIGEVTWADLAVEAAKAAQLDPLQVIAKPSSELGLQALRPPYSVLGSERGMLLPSLEHALSRYFNEAPWRRS